MSQAFFDDLEIPKPDYFLEAGSGSHAEQTARIMVSYERVCEADRPDPGLAHKIFTEGNEGKKGFLSQPGKTAVVLIATICFF